MDNNSSVETIIDLTSDFDAQFGDEPTGTTTATKECRGNGQGIMDLIRETDAQFERDHPIVTPARLESSSSKSSSSSSSSSHNSSATAISHGRVTFDLNPIVWTKLPAPSVFLNHHRSSQQNIDHNVNKSSSSSSSSSSLSSHSRSISWNGSTGTTTSSHPRVCDLFTFALLMDNRERLLIDCLTELLMADECVKMAEEGISFGMKVAQLSCGDALFILTCKTTGRRLLLPTIVERKTYEDLFMSITTCKPQVRFLDQQGRMTVSGVHRRIFVIEGDPHTACARHASFRSRGNHPSSVDTKKQVLTYQRTIHSAIDQLVLAGCHTLLTDDIFHTGQVYLQLAFVQIAHRHAEEWLHSDDYRACIDFDEFQTKLKRQTFWNQDLPLGGPRSLSLRMLYQLPGIGKEAAQPIIAMHPTLAGIIGALNANGNEPNDNFTSSSSSCSSSANSRNGSSSTSSSSLRAMAGCESIEGMSNEHHMLAGTHIAARARARAIGDTSRTPTKHRHSKPTTAAALTAAVTPSHRIPINTGAPPLITTKKRKAPEPLVFPSCGPHKNNVLKTFFCTYF